MGSQRVGQDWVTSLSFFFLYEGNCFHLNYGRTRNSPLQEPCKCLSTELPREKDSGQACSSGQEWGSPGTSYPGLPVSSACSRHPTLFSRGWAGRKWDWLLSSDYLGDFYTHSVLSCAKDPVNGTLRSRSQVNLCYRISQRDIHR